MLILPFQKLKAQDADIAGGKGASLGEMTQAGIPVPPGFVVLSGAFDGFIDETHLNAEIEAALDLVNHEEMHTVENASKRIQALIHNAGMPPDIGKAILGQFKELDAKFVAVRSSATSEDSADAAWAGQLDTYLNTTEDQLLENVKRCWASLFTPRAIFYRFEKGLHHTKISVAVVVQNMVESEVSGIAFSVHPVTQDYNQMIIEAGLGLGEAIVSGSITPDSYVVEKEPFRILDKNVSVQEKAMVRGAEGGSIWREVEKERGEKQALSDQRILELASVILRIERHYGFPCDIEWALEGGKFYITQSRPITTLFKKENGHGSIEEAPRWEKVLQRNFPPFAWTASGHYEFNGLSIGPMKWKRDREMHIRYKSQQSYMIQDPAAYYISNINDVIREINPLFEEKMDEYNGEIHEAVRKEPGKTLKDLAELVDLHRWMYGLMLVGFDVAIDIRNRIDEVVKERGPEFESYLLTPWKQTAIGRETAGIAEAKEAAKKNSDVRVAVTEKLSADFGYLHQDYLGQSWSPGDYEQALKDPALQSHMDDAHDISRLDPYEQWLITIFKKVIYMYEEGRNAMVRCMWAIKETAKALGTDPDALLYMTDKEVAAFASGKGSMIPPDLLGKRKEAFALYFENGSYREYTGEEEVKQLILDQDIMRFWEDKAGNEDSLEGSIAFKGHVKGKARLVFTQADANAVEQGEIIVTPMTQVEFLSGIRKCAAIVTDEGGIISHAAIVAREFGKPCILNTRKATKVFRNGDLIEVDANLGVVKRLALAENEGFSFVNRDWKKNWAGGWAALSSAYLAYQYTKQLKDVLGVCLEEALLISHGSLTACYFIDAHKKKFGTHFAGQAIKDPGAVSAWAATLKEKTNAARSLIEAYLKEDFSPERFGSFLEAIYAYGVPHRIVKVTVDYLPADILDRSLDTLAEARVYAEPVYEEMEKYYRHIAGKIGDRHGLEPELVLAMNRTQFEDYLKAGILPSTPVLKEQCGNSAFYVSGGSELAFSGEKDVTEIERLLSDRGETKELSGQTAYPGKARGSVRIVLDPSKVTDFRDGEILVTGMTRPEYLSLVQRSAGFITDAGGILSHAAITARELKKPCVIGTESATRVLKNGDLVEIDADRGLIRIIS